MPSIQLGTWTGTRTGPRLRGVGGCPTKGPRRIIIGPIEICEEICEGLFWEPDKPLRLRRIQLKDNIKSQSKDLLHTLENRCKSSRIEVHALRG